GRSTVPGVGSLEPTPATRPCQSHDYLRREIFTDHQDKKVRVWKIQAKNPGTYKRAGTLPSFFDIFNASIKPRNYVEVKCNRSGLWIKHIDAISCLSVDQTQGLLYSVSWDRTFKVSTLCIIYITIIYFFFPVDLHYWNKEEGWEWKLRNATDFIQI
ncbi:hypothetical protein HAX54_024306, partial [Datura stramonium]|nr:hypothetical protein [Datura stramonium]